MRFIFRFVPRTGVIEIWRNAGSCTFYVGNVRSWRSAQGLIDTLAPHFPMSIKIGTGW